MDFSRLWNIYIDYRMSTANSKVQNLKCSKTAAQKVSDFGALGFWIRDVQMVTGSLPELAY